ncbi:MAG: ABC transporter substrate-binding protein [Methylobacteriaceae bacterium]|jgi:iron(III) transport system substrate-binding protein|nr:ABC transporter substrate-binding protein [Methylobacteriaceae bacterium]
MTHRFWLSGVAVFLAMTAAPTPGYAQDNKEPQALVDAAKKEGELVAYWHSSRITKAGAAFEKAYGIKVLGTKMNDTETTEKIVREVESGNIQADVIGYDDGPRLITELLPGNYVTNYVPADAADLPEISRNPLVYLWQVTVFGYNNETHKECPISNVWQLTEPEWKGKFHMFDPRLRSTMIQMFSAIEDRSEEMAASYQDFYGKPLEMTEKNAGLEFIKRLAANQPILYNEDLDIAAAVGTRGQKDPPMGFYFLGRHREAAAKNHALDICNLVPFQGFAQPSFAQTVTGSPHPNAAKLFISFILTDEGVSPWTTDIGAYSPLSTLKSSPDNPYPSLEAWGTKMLYADNAHVTDRRQDLLDFWITSSRP